MAEPVRPDAVSTNSPLRISVLGTGARGQAFVTAVREHPDAVLVGDEAGVSTDYDAVLIAGGDEPTLAERARGALQRGQAVLWAGMPADPALLDELGALATRHGAALSLPNELRYLPATRAAREAVARGETGPLLGVFAAWRAARALGPDPFRELALPLLDYLGWCLPGGFTRVQATVAPLFGPERPAALLTLRHASGVVATVEIVAPPAGCVQDDEVTIEILGEEAALRVEPFNQAIAITTAGRSRRVPWHRPAAYPLVDDFVLAVRDGREPPGSPEELRPTLALIEELRGVAGAQR